MIEEWQTRAERLADKLAADGDLHYDEWRAAVCAVPRHELVPRYYEQEGPTYRLVTPDDDASRRAWLDLVYSDTTLTTAVVADSFGRQVPVSSSTKPDLMVRMLEALDVHDGHTVLEVGTGTGYNAALLSHRLGADRVFSIDLRPELVDAAADRLATIGYRPVLRAVDGSGGLAEHAPYDRIMATCSVAAIPGAWIEQAVPGGLILVDVEGQLSAGNLVLLRRGDELMAEGRFLDWYGRFMPLRHDATGVGQPWPTVDRSGGDERTTAVNPAELDGEFRFLAQFRLPAGTRHTLTVDDGAPTATCLTHRDGSWCSVDRTGSESGRYRVHHAGSRDLWADVEHAHDEWATMGAPAWHRFGLTATPTTQRVWLDSPDSEHTWNLTI
ncbi:MULTISPECIES: methyltransferase domain-containing protein [Actinoalloteichus]|uniref:Protein-L-isoaspartate O-methyltransferase n=1 Tax=Actinoalloteichus fjordicus TaxID=1612552 RepID=A0AAC9LEM9_9PSEU|nr:MULTISPECIES: methyltransferase domain-containing protein [Actinoalloteichus]APU15986.1 protein-L-isoaspartate carboxylmethyltransferase [Actinoalloteichus fjordicus]APU22050.1 protein-L-isoaspartate carboxylmethyltransferase [Actinoalloteichus sp. GBA129-24]